MATKPVRALSKTSPDSSPGPSDTPGAATEGLLVINEKFEAIAADEGAMWIFAPEIPEGEGLKLGPSLPEEIQERLGAMKHLELPTAKLRIRLGKSSYSCRVFLLQRIDGTADEPLLALHVSRDSSVSDAVDLLAEDYNLTDREQEALKAIAIGLTSKETAERMNISPNTVKSFLRIIMLKMGVSSRAAMMGKLLEYRKRT